jgi:hypothetical protein
VKKEELFDETGTQRTENRGIKERKQCKGGKETKKKTGNIYSSVTKVEGIFYLISIY